MDAREIPDFYAWVGMDELGSGKVGYKRCSVGDRGLIPLARMNDAGGLPTFAEVMDKQAAQFGHRIRLVRFQAVEILLETEHGV